MDKSEIRNTTCLPKPEFGDGEQESEKNTQNKGSRFSSRFALPPAKARVRRWRTGRASNFLSGFPGSEFWHRNFLKKIAGQSPMPKSTTGFTLFELVVTLSIFVLLTTAILIKNSRFKNDILITNLAYEVALAVREAQVYGISVSASDYDDPDPNYELARGVHFDLSNPNEFILFLDGADENLPYDIWIYGEGIGGDSVASKFKIKAGSYLKDLCVLKDGDWDCGENLSFLDITFKRPEPEAHIFINGENDTEYDAAQIWVSSTVSGGDPRKIEVRSTGQISVLPN